MTEGKPRYLTVKEASRGYRPASSANHRLVMPQPREEEPGFVYAVQSGINGPIKIGMTINHPHWRIKELEVSNPEVLLLRGIHRTNTPRHTERLIHQRLSDRWIRGEWFELSEKDLHELFTEFDFTWRMNMGPLYGIQVTGDYEK